MIGYVNADSIRSTYVGGRGSIRATIHNTTTCSEADLPVTIDGDHWIHPDTGVRYEINWCSWCLKRGRPEPPGEWAKRGACLHSPIDMFPHRLGDRESLTTQKARIAAAKAVCGDCPVLEECRAHALKWEEYGIWGGLTRGERVRLRGGGYGSKAVVA